jgi:hypothetical protein
MTRLLLVGLTTLFVFCGCQSAPTLAQSAAPASQSRHVGFFDSVVQGVSSLWGGGAAPEGVAPGKSAPPPVTLADVTGGVASLKAQLAAMQAQLDAVQLRTSKIDHRSGQGRLLVLGLLGLNGVMVLVVLLMALGIIGRPLLFTDAEKAKLLELRAVGKRQAELTVAIGELQAFAAQVSGDREQFTALLTAAQDELKRLEAATATVAESARG